MVGSQILRFDTTTRFCPTKIDSTLNPDSDYLTGFLGVRKRPTGACVWLVTFYMKDVAASAYDIAAWRFGRPRHETNFPEVRSLTES
jgi:hypothetical protein